MSKLKQYLNYFEALKNMYVKDIVKNGNMYFCIGDLIDDNIWNTALVKGKNVDFIKLEKFYESGYNLKPSFMLEGKKERKFYDYENLTSDAFMKMKIKPFKFIKKTDCEFVVAGEKNKIDVIETIMNGFSTHDPADPYGELSPLYREALNKNFGKSGGGFKTFHVLAYLNKKPVAVASATYKKKTAFINNVTVLKEYRGKGINKDLTSFLFCELLKLKIKNAKLSTEYEAYTEKVWQKLGFKTVAVFRQYIKKS